MMNRLFVLLACTGLGVVTASEPARAQGRPAAPVQELNVDAHGNIRVHEQGTASVKSVIEPVQKSTFSSFATGERFTDEVTLYTVPAGKVLVIDAVTVSSVLSPSDRLFDATFNVMLDDPILPFEIRVQPAAEGVFTSTNGNVFSKTQAITAYAGPGTAVTARASRDGTSLSGTAILFGFAGHLVDAQ